MYLWSLYFLNCCLTDVSFQLQVVVVIVVVVIEVAVEHQVVMAVVVMVIEAAVEHQVVMVVVEEEEATEEEVMEVPKEAQTLSLNLTNILVFLSPKAKTISWSPKILFPENLYMARNRYLLKVVLKAQKMNILF